MTVEAGKSKTYKADQQAENSGKISILKSLGRTPSSARNLSFSLKAFN